MPNSEKMGENKEKINRRKCFRVRDEWYACMDRETAQLKAIDFRNFILEGILTFFAKILIQLFKPSILI